MRLIMRPTAEPASEPVTLGQLRDHVRADDDVDDAALIGFGVSARQLIEQWLGRPIQVQTVRGIGEAWPCSGGLELSMPINTIEAVTYTDASGVVMPWATGRVARTSQGGITQIRPATGSSWPVLGDDPLVTVDATAGFAVVPEAIVTAICKLAGYLHADRDGIGDRNSGVGDRNTGVGRLPPDIRELIAPWRWRLLA